MLERNMPTPNKLYFSNKVYDYAGGVFVWDY